MEPNSTQPTPSEPPPDPSDETEEDLVDAAADDAQARLWLRTITALLQIRSIEPDPADRVQRALDRLWIAAADRAARILRSDMLD